MARRNSVRGLGDLHHRRIVMEATTLAATTARVPLAEVLARNRKRARAAFARQLAMYLSHVAGKMSLGEIADACHAMEDRRECPIFDAQMDVLEREMARQIARIVADAKRRPARYLEYKGLMIA